jgi:hypothetical protein
MLLFSTHPPLLERIRRIEPDFQEADLEALAANMAHGELKSDQRQEVTAGTGGANLATAGATAATGYAGLEPGGLINQIGQPGRDRVMLAALLVASIPDGVRQAAQSIEWAPAVLFYCLLDVVTETREQQLLLIARHMGADSEGQVRALLTIGNVPSAAQRLPLLELAFPALKRRPAEFVTRVLATVQELVQVNSRVDVFEYLLARLVTQHLWESQNPHRVRLSGSSPLTSWLPQVSRVLAILATHGHDGPAEAELAYQAGMARLVAGNVAGMPATGDWVRSLDEDLPKLDQVRSKDKEQLVGALMSTTLYDGRFKPVELELLRVICGMLHIPLPLLANSV